MRDPLKSKKLASARQHRYYMAHREEILKKCAESYDPVKRATEYEEKRADICKAARLNYLLRRADKVRALLEEMRTHADDATRPVIDQMLSKGAHHEMTVKEVKTLYKTLEHYPPPPPKVDKCDEAIISLRQ